MKIRERIVVAYVGLLVLLLLLAGVGLSLTSRLGGDAAGASVSNVRSIRNATKLMREMPQLTNQAYFGNVEGGEIPPEARAMIDEFDMLVAEFGDGLRSEATDSAARELQTAWDGYLSDLAQMFAMPAGQDKELLAEERVRPATSRLRELLGEIVEANLSSLNADFIATQEDARRSQVLLLALAGLGVVLCVGFLAALGPLLAQPSRELVEAIDAMAKDDALEAFLPKAGPDEIGAVAGALRKLIERIRETRKVDAKLIRQLERRCEDAMDCIPDALLLADRSGRILYSNDVAKKLLGTSAPADMASLPWPIVRELFDGCVATGEARVSKDLDKALQIFLRGEERFYLPGAFPLVEDGTLEEVVLLLNDVSYLRQLDEMKTDMVATVSHQLKTPLTAIRMSLRMLKGGGNPALSDTERELLGMALDESERLQSTIESLLDMARIQSGAIQMDMRMVETGPWMQELAEAYRPLLDEHGIELQVDIDDALPRLELDTTRMGIVIDNLMTNCAKYCRNGDTVAVRASVDGSDAQTVIITVADTGPGIPAADLARVFEKFYRGKDRGKPGAGLGLSIARSIVQAHGGTMACYSAEGGGTTFSVALHSDLGT